MRLTVTLAVALAPGLLGACATVARSPAPPPANPDCSFRAATSCWTPAARFPSRPVEPPDTARGKILDPPAVVLASEINSTELDSTQPSRYPPPGRGPAPGSPGSMTSMQFTAPIVDITTLETAAIRSLGMTRRQTAG